jgi:hypothetical protein
MAFSNDMIEKRTVVALVAGRAVFCGEQWSGIERA